MSFQQLIEGRKVLVCCGAGGVGKTTIAASIGLRCAMEGMKTLVLTIDPAKRLADSLGLSELGNRQTPITLPGKAKGRLWGMMLDQKRTFDNLIERIAPSEKARQNILNNHFYQQISGHLTGSEEYMAMEKLYDIHQRDEFDLVVLDTPPTRHALDFLDAPRRMMELMDEKIIQWFVKPYFMAGKLSFQFAQKGASVVFKILERITGSQALRDLAEFFLAFDGLYDGFKNRAGAVLELLSGEKCAFVIVTTAQRPAVDEAAFFRDRLRQSNMPLGAVVFNRIQESIGVDRVDEEKASAEKIIEKMPRYASVVDALIDLAVNSDKIARAQKELMEGFVKGMDGDSPVFRIPAMPTDIHDIRGLLRVGGHFGA